MQRAVVLLFVALFTCFLGGCNQKGLKEMRPYFRFLCFELHSYDQWTLIEFRHKPDFQDYMLTGIYSTTSDEAKVDLLNGIRGNLCEDDKTEESCGCWMQCGNYFEFIPSEGQKASHTFVEAAYSLEFGVLMLKEVDW